MHPLLQSIYASGSFTKSTGEQFKVIGETSLKQCEFLQSLIRKYNCSKSLEIGFAFGLSTLAIAEAIVANNGKHIVIDKFQLTDWNGTGLDLVKQAGYADKVEFREQFCYEVLPELLAKGTKIDFAYIDSTKQFDWLMMNFFFIDRLLVDGGVVVFDDLGYYGIRKLIRFLRQYPHITIESIFPENVKPGFSERLSAKINSLPFIRSIARQSQTVADYNAGINGHCIALRKTSEDKRSWDWHAEF
jgi:predicted O-methyltransferase YrrM